MLCNNKAFNVEEIIRNSWQSAVNPDATGTQIKKIREAKKLTQSQLARDLGVSRQAANAWEMGKCCPSRENFVMLANVFSCKLQDLVISYRQEVDRTVSSVTAAQPLTLDTGRAAKTLRAKRVQHNLTREALSGLTEGLDEGASISAIQHWETGKALPSMGHLLFLAWIYNCTLDELLGLETAGNGGDDADGSSPLCLFKPMRFCIGFFRVNYGYMA